MSSSADGVFSPQELAAEKIARSNRELAVSDIEDDHVDMASKTTASGMTEINIDPLPREDMVLEGAEEGGMIDKKRQRLLLGSCVLFFTLVAIILGISIPLAIKNSPSAHSANSNTNNGGSMGDELLIDEGVLEDEETEPFTFDDEDVTATDATDESGEGSNTDPGRWDAIIAELRTLSGDAVVQSSTPQNQAANFIINEDPLQMDASSSFLKQRYVVALLYFSLNGPQWKNQTNLLSGRSECEWAGITCSSTSRHIHKINWRNNTMDGIVPEEIGALGNLEILNLGVNSLDGRIPSSIWTDLTKLKLLDLGENMFSGQIPSEVSNLVQIRELNLHGNLMNGPLPGSSLGALIKLETLKLYTNDFTGEIPKELGSLSELRRLDLDDNDLRGEIPNELGYLTKVHTLWLNQNAKISGTIPEGFFTNMTMLQKLFLGNMGLTGTVSENVGNLKELQFLQVKANKLTGTIPHSIGNCSKLMAMEFDGNNFVGPLPHSMGNLAGLQVLYLSNNNFGHGIPSQWSGMKNLTTLVASQANLTGIFYPEFGEWSKLKYLLLDRNAMTDPLPPQIGDLSNLSHLYLYNNKFSGPIPPEVGKLTELREAVIDQNNFVGQIPSELGQLKQLVTMFLFKNNLTGQVPEAVCNLKEQANLKNLWADCQSGLECSCCTACCVFNDAYSGCYYMDN